jgi:hypothetical protein
MVVDCPFNIIVASVFEEVTDVELVIAVEGNRSE